MKRWILAAASLVLAQAALAQSGQYPERPIRFIVGLATGGPTDLSARALAAAATKQLGQPIVVVNIPGAAQTLAMAELARAPADGYTIAMITSTYRALTAHQQKLAFDTNDLQTLLGYAEFRHLMFVQRDSRFKTIQDVIRYGKDHPGALTFGHVGAGSSLQLQGLIFFKGAGVQVTDVPYKGSAEFTNAVLGKQIDLALIEISGVRALAKAGTARLLVTVTAERFPEFPEVPTAREMGIEGPEYLNPLVGVAVRRGTPPEIVKRLHDALRRAMDNPEFAGAMGQMGLKSGYTSPEAFDAVIAKAQAHALPLMREVGLVKQ